MVHFNDVLGVTASILIKSLGEIYPIICLQGNWKSVPQQGCILIGHNISRNKATLMIGRQFLAL